mmetsp:Transcript_95498/g.273923  ORF Transcript_95498/g.273923 Transcript_95498/m.273923 type:complete len:162 (-) Transcript_95498:300-785(-)
MGAACCTQENDQNSTPLQVAKVEPAFRQGPANEEVAPPAPEPEPPLELKEEAPAPQLEPPKVKEEIVEEVVEQEAEGMVITFQLSTGSMKHVAFTSGPVGLDFERKMPIIVKRIKEGSPGQALGVGLGWEIVSIDGVSLRDMDFQSAFATLKGSCARLPNA